MKYAGKLTCWCVGAALVTAAAGEELYPIYTVTTSAAATTNLIDNMDVQVQASADAEIATQAFSAIDKSAGNFSGTFRKRGEGFLQSSSSMLNFTGEIRIEEGAVIIKNTGDLGGTYVKSSDLFATSPAVPTLVISNGASLVIFGETKNCCKWGNHTFFGGEGYQGMGAICNLSPTEQNSCYYGGWELTADAKVVNNGAVWADRSSVATDGGYKLNGHTLTFTGTVSSYTHKINGAVFHPGHVVFTGKYTPSGQSNMTFDGGDDPNEVSTLTVDTGITLGGYNLGTVTFSGTPWKLILKDGSRVGYSQTISMDRWKKANCENWNGPVDVQGNVKVNSGYSVCNGATALYLNGAVGGVGGFAVTCGWLQLANDANTFAGPLVVDAAYTAVTNTGIGFNTADAFPKNNAHALAVTNGCVYLGAKNVKLPQTICAVTADVETRNTCFMGDGSATVAGLEKTGAGTLTLAARTCVTGTTHLKEGTIKIVEDPTWVADYEQYTNAYNVLYSDAPGLWESVTKFGTADNLPANARNDYFINGVRADTNGVTAALRYLQKTGNAKVASITDLSEIDWTYYQVARYEGWIWNRSETTERWSLAIAAIQGRCYLDGEPVLLKQSEHWYNLATNTISVTPGPHRIDIRFWNSGYQAGGAKPAEKVQNGLTNADAGNGYSPFNEKEKAQSTGIVLPEVWPNDFGFGIDFQGRSSLYSADYEKPTNRISKVNGTGGDGYRFTLTDETAASYKARTADRTAALLAAYWRTNCCTRLGTLKAARGTQVILGQTAYPMELDGFEGAVTMTDGSVTINGRTVLSSEAVAAGETALAVSGTLTFGADAVIAADEPFGAALRGRTLRLVSAGSIVGTPAFDSASFGEGARITCANGAVDVYVPKHLTMIILR